MTDHVLAIIKKDFPKEDWAGYYGKDQG